MVLSAKCSVLL